MSDGSSIEWLAWPGYRPASWNPAKGCTSVSEGCRNCYAEVMAARFSKPGQWGHGIAEMRGGDHRWTGRVGLDEAKLLPLRWRSPRVIFVNSTSDLFHERLPDEAIDRVFAVMALCPQHRFICLTKRAERMLGYFSPETSFLSGNGAFSREEIAAIVRAARAERRCRDHLPLFVLLATYTGKRSEAIRTLQWRPNTERDGWIDVAAGMIHWGYSGTKKRRGEPTPIPRPVIGILRARARRGGKYVLTTGRTRKDRASGRFNHSWGSALRRAGVEPGRMHDLRHTAASVMLSNGVEPWLAAQYLGMTVETLTRVYGHMIPGALKRAVDAVVRKA